MLRELHGNDLAALVRFSRERLFDAADMTSAFFEPIVVFLGGRSVPFRNSAVPDQLFRISVHALVHSE